MRFVISNGNLSSCPDQATPISYLAFVDDVLVFAKTSEKKISLIRHILDVFCRFSGQEISQTKTAIFFPKNVDGHVRSNICNVVGFQITNDLVKYLGVPFFIKKSQ